MFLAVLNYEVKVTGMILTYLYTITTHPQPPWPALPIARPDTVICYLVFLIAFHPLDKHCS